MPRKAAEKKIEDVIDKNKVVLERDGIEFTLSDQTMISAFKNQGYKEKE
ncbi:hypothetical protein ACFKP6_07610 [Streptococcus uberis]